MAFSSHICTIVLVVCIMLLYHKQLYIRTVSNKLFEYMLYWLVSFSTLSILIQILSGSDSSRSVWLLSVSMRFFCFVILGYVFSLENYVFYWLHVKLSKPHHVLRIFLCLFVFCLPVSVQYTEVGLGVSGVGFVVTGDILCATIIYLVIILCLNRDYMSVAIQQGFGFFAIVVLISLIADMCFHVNFIDFACAIGSFWMFYNIENPKAKVDTISGFFTTHVILDYIDSLPNQYAHIGIIYTRDDHLDLNLFKTIAKKSRVCCFRDTDSFYYIVSQDMESVQYVLNRYREKYDVITLTYKNAVSDSFSVISNYVKQNVNTMNESRIYEIVDSDLTKLVDENQAHLEIIDALLEDRICTYIQPIYGVKEGRIVSGECLCRIISRNGEIISPYQFIPVAERTGLIVEIETRMFCNMCKCLADPRIQQSSIHYLEANLSVKKAEQQELLSEYTRILQEYGVSSDMVNLEITETDVAEEKANILKNMYAMQSLGFNFSLDDFGSGESNLGYIIDMPVSVIKFDSEITQKAVKGRRALTVVKSAIDMAHDLNMKVVVEGVETKEDFDLCVSLGADFVQGYYFSHPLPMEEFIEYVYKQSKL